MKGARSAQEIAQGRAQIDYVRRLVGQLDREDDSESGGSRLRAIGVLGSDVYDKLMPIFRRAAHCSAQLGDMLSEISL